MAYLFGLGRGHLGRKAEKAAKVCGVDLVNYTDAECNCGFRCRPHTCAKSRRHWFSASDANGPAIYLDVLAYVTANCSAKDRELLEASK